MTQSNLQHGWLTREAARRLGVGYQFKEERIRILYDFIRQDSPLGNIANNVANKVYLPDGGYVGALIEVGPDQDCE